MSYTKNTWKSGDIVTSAKLNNIEDGIAALENLQGNTDIPTPTAQDSGKVLGVNEQGAYALVAGSSGGGGGALYIEATYDSDTDTTTLGKTWQEIKNAFDAGSVVAIAWDTGDISYMLVAPVTNPISGGYSVVFLGMGGGSFAPYVFECTNTTDYPHMEG